MGRTILGLDITMHDYSSAINGMMTVLKSKYRLAKYAENGAQRNQASARVSCDRCGNNGVLLALLSVLDCSPEVTLWAVLHHKVVDRACFIIFQETDDVYMIQGRQNGRFLAKQLYLGVIVGGPFLNRLDGHQLSVSPALYTDCENTSTDLFGCAGLSENDLAKTAFTQTLHYSVAVHAGFGKTRDI